MINNEKESFESTLLEVLKDMNLKVAELDELRQDVQRMETEVEAYKRMCDEYKEAAEDRWERLKFYENNKLIRLMCSLHIRLKKKEINKDVCDDGDNVVRNSDIRQRYYALYSQQEKEDFEKCRLQLKKAEYRPLISLVIPVYNTDLDLLNELYFSLKEQLYDNWEVCFANGSKDNKELNNQLQRYAKKDKRVKFKILDINGGISYNTNRAFEMASGEFIGMVDHDDLLSPNALAEVVLALNRKKDLDFIYSDQDKVDEKTTRRFGTLYKPFWSMELLYSGNYITHFSVIRSSMISEVGLWDSETDGAQDWDLFLKVAEKTDKIYAISKVLYHWRTAPTSTALSMDTKNYAAEAQIRSLQNHFDRMGYNAEVSFSRPKDLEIHVKWKNDFQNKVSVIVYDEEKNLNIDNYLWFIKLALKDSIRDLIFVSSDKKRLNAVQQECKKIYISHDDYAWGYNKGAETAEGDILIFATDMAFPLSTDTYQELAGWAAHPQIGMVGPKILNKDGTINSVGLLLNAAEPAGLFHGYRNEPGRLTAFGTTSWYRDVTAMDYLCFAIEKNKYQEMGGFKPDKGRLTILDFCIRMGIKYRNMINPFAVIQNNRDFVDTIKKNYTMEYSRMLHEYCMPDVDRYFNSELIDMQ